MCQYCARAYGNKIIAHIIVTSVSVNFADGSKALDEMTTIYLYLIIMAATDYDIYK